MEGGDHGYRRWVGYGCHCGHSLVDGVAVKCPTCGHITRMDTLQFTAITRPENADTYVPWLAPWSATNTPERTQTVEFVYIDERQD